MTKKFIGSSPLFRQLVETTCTKREHAYWNLSEMRYAFLSGGPMYLYRATSVGAVYIARVGCGCTCSIKPPTGEQKQHLDFSAKMFRYCCAVYRSIYRRNL